ncbi:MAG: GuaB3 family IMP dehydrogenase-related protein [Dehalococcoidia bacterium]|nr:GuaB3 family IMP dehydrogenase-related protein [Dehalococcoidia bacterium]
MGTPQFKEIRRAYGFDDISIAPGAVTVNPDQTNIEFTLGGHTFRIPIIASAMDAVVSPDTAVKLSQMGSLGVLNLDGLWTRYEDAAEILAELTAVSLDKVTPLFQKFYTEPIKDNLIAKRVQQIKRAGGVCAVSTTPQNTKRLAPAAVEAGADIVFVQSTVTTARHISKSYEGLVLNKFVQQIKVPVVVGNVVGYETTLELMGTGVQGILVGVGPGAACTTREVTGVGIPQVTATLDCAAARETFYKQTGRYVPIITDGGIRTGGDLCKTFASGADAAMIGTPFAQTFEAAGRGYNWGMAAPHPALPRGIRIKVGQKCSMEQLLYGPSAVTDGTQNLVGALRVGMGMIGAMNIKEMQQAELVYAPDIKTEGKTFQMAQK